MLKMHRNIVLAIITAGIVLASQAWAHPSLNHRINPDSAPGDSLQRGTDVDCVCSGAFATGDRVTLQVDNPDSASNLPAGSTGTVVCGAYGEPPLLVSWDNWTQGHDGNGFCVCPSTGTTATPTSGWYVYCTDVTAAAAAQEPGPDSACDCCCINFIYPETISRYTGGAFFVAFLYDCQFAITDILTTTISFAGPDSSGAVNGLAFPVLNIVFGLVLVDADAAPGLYAVSILSPTTTATGYWIEIE